VLGLAALDAAETAGAPPQRAHGYVLRLERLRALQRTMMQLSPAERRKLPGMNPRRSDIIVAGNAIVIATMEALGREELVVSERALREGIVVDYLERNIALARKIGDEQTRRFDAAHALARRFGTNDVHETASRRAITSSRPTAMRSSQPRCCTISAARFPRARITSTARISSAMRGCPVGGPMKWN
jgi:exopolyphosphatase/guanosine-5'-triphosphate,3'-diphosphate pyrophosphatase